MNKEFLMEPADGRVAIVRSISMQPEIWQYLHNRVRELRPRIVNRSHYFQLLVEMERLGVIDILNMRAAGSSPAQIEAQVAAGVARMLPATRPGPRKDRKDRKAE